MKKTITRGIIMLALSLMSAPVVIAQCGQITGLSATPGANGTATVSASTSGPIGMLTRYYWSINGSWTQNTPNSNTVLQFPSNGSYTVCAQFTDSTNMCASNQYCTVINITNMNPSACQAGFTYNTDSNCVTHFVNTSVGSNLTYQWYIGGTSYTSANPNVSLSNGTHYAILYTYSNGAFCDSLMQIVSVGCGAGTGNCNAAFNYFTDTLNCQTHFNNQSTGTGLTYGWYDYDYTASTYNGLVSTSGSPVLNLSPGVHHITLYTYSNGSMMYCDSITQQVIVSCNSGTVTPPAVCQVNAGFNIFADSVNAGNYFAYNTSTGNGTLTYLWNFGDGNTSTQQYPFHQYATPGQYIVCLTVTSTSGTLSCSDTQCDSSSVQRIASGFLMSQISVIPQMTAGIKDNNVLASANAYPNPMTDELTIEVNTKELMKLNYVLVDALGRTVAHGTVDGSKATINTGNLQRGFYSLTITPEEGNSLKTIKLVK